MKNASARNLWGDFLDKHLEYAYADEPTVTHFCDNEKDANTCLKLVLKGVKRATSHSLLGLQYRKERLPKIGDFTIITDWKGKEINPLTTGRGPTGIITLVNWSPSEGCRERA